MKKTLLLLSLLLIGISFYGQSIYEDTGQMSFRFEEGSNYIQDWNPANVADNEWRKSRIPLADRFIYTPSQIDPSLSNYRKYILWGMLPFHTRTADNFKLNVTHMPQYRDIHALWVSGGGFLELPSPSMVDGYHKNGVKVTANITFADGTRDYENRWKSVFTKDGNGKFIHPAKIVEICKYYGLDGLSINFEVNSMSSAVDITASTCIEWMQAILEEAETQGMPDFELIKYWVWYDSGTRSWYIKGIDSSCDDWLHYNNKKTSTAAFLNYEWNSSGCSTSTNHLPTLGRSTYDNFVGVSFYGDKTWDFAAAKSYPVSWGFWGEPFLKSNEDPFVMPANPSDVDEELHRIDQYIRLFSGPTSNPKNASNAYATYTPAKFGAADVFPAKSVIQSLPFNTYFNTGSGVGFYSDGIKIHDNQWSDYGVSDIMPTWYWYWKTGGTGLEASLDFYDAYYGGSSIKVEGSIPSGNNELRLYKTKLAVDGTTKLYLTYKVSESANVNSNLDVTLQFENGSSLSTTSFMPVGIATTAGWNTKEIDLSSYSGQTLAVVGINISGSSSNYQLNLGNLRITNGNVAAPSAPVNVEVTDILSSQDQYSVVLNWELPNAPAYNNEANVDYFEIYQVDTSTGEKQLIGRSVHRGFVGTNIPKMTGVDKVVFTVASVAADGTTKAFSNNFAPVSGDFSVSKRYVATGATVDLTAITDDASSYGWTIEGPENQVLTGQNVSVTLNTAGFYNITSNVVINGQTFSTKKYGVIQMIDNFSDLDGNLSGTLTASNQSILEGETVNFDYTIDNPSITFKKAIALTSNDRIGVSKSVLGSSNSWTISFWHNIDAFYNGTCQLIRNRNLSNGSDDWILTLSNVGTLKLGADTLLAPKNITAGEWNMYTLSYSAGVVKFYLNGTKVTEKNIALSVTNDPTGYLYLKNAPYASKLDEIQVYNRALTDAEVNALNVQIQSPANGLVFYASCDETLDNIVNNTDLLYQANGTAITNPPYVNGTPWFFTIGGDYSYDWIFEGGNPATSTQQSPSVFYQDAGVYDVSLTISDGVNSVSINQPEYIDVVENNNIIPVKMEVGTVTVSDTWQTVTLDSTYASMVVVTTPTYASLNDDPAVIRIRNAQGNSFEIKAQKAGSGTLNRTVNTQYIVAEEGHYTEEANGIKMEAVKATSTKCYYKWASNTFIEARVFNNTYVQPVVVGQVMSYNDTRWSAFYSCDASRNPVTGTSFYAGKHVGEDPVTTRNNETIGYIVFEEGIGEVGNFDYVAVNDGPIQSYAKYSSYNTIQLPANNLSGTLYGVSSMDGMVYSNLAWTNWWGTNALSTTSVNVSLDEDVIADTERIHGDEKVSIVLFSEKSSQLKAGYTADINSRVVSGMVSVFPNPCQSELHVEGVEEDTQYSLYSITGTFVKTGKIYNERINMSDIQTGMYMLKINEHVFRIVKK